ncbi:nucleoside phosphorylase [Williamwhitmania taraxaci]|uniref:Uridine phosphorylase n=1 Tax=Williamwhitmania taraxaci TaxID=1640674 RepID=A0A1G6GN57_9BACT|nr:nucleoside phosphorylase [Williamwhitmania taraxaci]SDB83417.1 uridine phosphorylase [Williamwhitmania taraxaci]
MRVIEPSELIINKDGSVFHLHMHPEDLAKDVILVGDPGRVELVASYFEKIECTRSNREFVSTTGYYKGKRITVLSTGIGTDNIDIVVNELDALANISLTERTVKKEHTSLNLIRIGTSGALQGDIPVGSFVLSQMSIGFDGLLNFYANRDKVSDLEMEKAFTDFTSWNPQCPSPYFVAASPILCEKMKAFTISGITISAPGFYGPQGRVLRLPLADGELNEKIESFSYKGRKITNFEMESSAIAGLSLLLGHQAVTICAIIANRVTKTAFDDYKPSITKLVENVLESIVSK